MRHLTSITEVYTADAAGDEQLAGRIMKGRQVGGALMEVPEFPNLKIIVSDKSHAARRLTQRGWKCDDFLWSVSNSFIMASSSPTQLIRNSTAMAGVFTAFVNRRQESGQSVVERPRFDTSVCLRAAKHRFESHSKPFGRMVLHYPDILLCMERIAFGRHGSMEALHVHCKDVFHLL